MAGEGMSFNAYWKYGDNWISNTRWIYRLLDRSETLYYNLKYGLHNLWIWLPIVWKDRDWDWVYLDRMMRFKLLRMAEGCAKYSYHSGKEKDVRQMRVVAELLRRMDDQPYYDNADARVNGDRRLRVKGESPWVRHICGQEKQDDELLGKMLSKHMRGWWW